MPTFDVELKQTVYYRSTVVASSPRAARRLVRQQITDDGEPGDCAESDNGEMTIVSVTVQEG